MRTIFIYEQSVIAAKCCHHQRHMPTDFDLDRLNVLQWQQKHHRNTRSLHDISHTEAP